MEGFGELVSAGQLTLSGLLLLGVLLVFIGQLVPKRTVDALLAARDAEILRANERANANMDLYHTERAAREITTEQNRELIEVARTVERVMEALQLVAEGRGGKNAEA